MMMGQYKIIENGEVVDVVNNVITNAGKQQLLQYIGKLRDGWADQMVFGVGSSSASSANTYLDLQTYSCPVYVSAVDTSTGQITLKTSIDIDQQFRFTELGIKPAPLFSDPSDVSYEKLFNFDAAENWDEAAGAVVVTKDDPTSYAGSTRGLYTRDQSQSIYLPATSGVTFTYKDLDLSKFPSSSKIVSGLTTTAALNGASGTIINFFVAGSNDTKYFSYSFPAAGTSNAYNVVSASLSAFTAHGGATTADWANIYLVEVDNLSSGNQLWDTMIIERRDTSVLSDSIFSRAVTSLKTKWAGMPYDIEYTVTIGL